MVNRIKYPELKGICKEAIKNEWCLGCNRLEDYHFTGLDYCKYVDIGKKEHLPNVSKMVQTKFI